VSRVLVLVRRGRHQPLVDVPARPAPAELDDGDVPDDGDLDPDDGLEPDDAADDTADDGADDGAFDDAVLDDEPLARTLVFLVLGFVVMVAGLASIIAG
jgi:hypothetical protein